MSSVAHDPYANDLEVEFRGGEIYVYSGVSRTVYDAFLRAESKGRFVRSILASYPCRHAEGSPTRPTTNSSPPPRGSLDSRVAETALVRKSPRTVRQIRSLWELQYKYGPVFDEVKAAFLYLPTPRLRALLDDYAALYGEGARQYAIRTIPMWRAGITNMSGQTMTRLLDLVPQHLDQGSKYRLIEKLREQTLKRMRRTEIRLRLRADDDQPQIVEGALSLIQKQCSIELPGDLYELGGWITADDAELMQKLVVEIERQMLIARAADLVINVALLQRVRHAIPHAKLVRATFDVPTASLQISITRPRSRSTTTMSANESDTDLLAQLQRAENDHHFQTGTLTFQEYVLRNMDRYFTPQQQSELNQLAARQGIELNKLKAEILIRGQTSSHDIQELLKLLDQLKAQGAVADINAEYQTPSGKIQIKAKSHRFGCFILAMPVPALFIALHFAGVV